MFNADFWPPGFGLMNYGNWNTFGTRRLILERCFENATASSGLLKNADSLDRVPLLACSAVLSPGNLLHTAGQASSGTHFSTAC